jgi:hypothetical protein
MCIENLILIRGIKRYKVTIDDTEVVIQSDILGLLNKTGAYVWRWARLRHFKVYFENTNP